MHVIKNDGYLLMNNLFFASLFGPYYTLKVEILLYIFQVEGSLLSEYIFNSKWVIFI